MKVSRYQYQLVLVLSVLYVALSLFSIDTSMYYLMFELLLLAIFLFSFFMASGIYKKLPTGFYIISFIIVLVSGVSALLNPNLLIYNFHYIAYYLLCIAAYALFSMKNMSIDDVVSGINQFYIIYLSISIVMWFFELEVGSYSLGEKFTLELFDVNKSILVGLDGSPASIDSFSALVLVLNLFFGVSRKNSLVLGVSIVALILSYRLTPMVAMILTFLSYAIITNRMAWLSVIISIHLFYLLLIYMSWQIMQSLDSIQGQDYLYLYNATHARFVIWGQQVNIMLENYSLYNYVFGGFDNELFSVDLYQVGGERLARTTYNSHSSILLLFFRTPFLFTITYLTYLFLIVKYYDRRKAAIAVFIFFSLTMNSSLLATGNPVFTIVMILLALPSNIKQEKKIFIRKNIEAVY